jgi:hypothetical protein
MTRWLFTLLATLGGLTAPTISVGQDAPKSTPEQRLAFAKQAAAAYRFRIGGRDKPAVMLQPEPLLRWNNQVVREDDGVLFLWTEGDKGRPLATAQFFVVERDWHHEFQSLSLSPFDARHEHRPADDWSWRPGGPGLEFVQADHVDVPTDSASGRLRQMKAIAERFTAAIDRNTNFASPEQLRLLTTPLYRYSASSQGILDGALFAFVQGTNPEVLLLIEAQGVEAAERIWRYGFARMSSYNLRVRRGEQTVWEREFEPIPMRSSTSPYFFRFGVQVDRSAEIELPATRGK